MSDVPSPNPYSAPNTPDPPTGRVAFSAPQSGAQKARSLAGWQLLFAVLSFLFFGMVLLYMGLMTFRFGGGGAMGFSFALALMFLFSLSYLVVGVVLVWASSSARRFSSTPTAETLTELMRGQMVLWRTVGILTIAVISLWLFSMLLNFMVFF